MYVASSDYRKSFLSYKSTLVVGYLTLRPLAGVLIPFILGSWYFLFVVTVAVFHLYGTRPMGTLTRSIREPCPFLLYGPQPSLHPKKSLPPPSSTNNVGFDRLPPV